MRVRGERGPMLAEIRTAVKPERRGVASGGGDGFHGRARQARRDERRGYLCAGVSGSASIEA